MCYPHCAVALQLLLTICHFLLIGKAAVGDDAPTLKINPDATIEYWNAVHFTPNIVEAIGDDLWITTDDGNPTGKVVRDEFLEFAKLFRIRVASLRKLDTVGVDMELVEWNLRCCLVVELHSQVLALYSKTYNRYVSNPLGGISLVTDNIETFVSSYDAQSGLELSVLKGTVAVIGKHVGSLKAFEAAVKQLRDDVIRQKYEVRARVSQRLGKRLPLDDDGCPVIAFVPAGSIGNKCGLQPGDVLLTYSGKSLSEEAHDHDVLSNLITDSVSNENQIDIGVRRQTKHLLMKAPAGKKLGIIFVVSPANRPEPWVRYVPQYRTFPKVLVTNYPYKKSTDHTAP